VFFISEIVQKTDKQETVVRIKETFQQSSSAICIDFRGVNVAKITQFRREIAQAAGTYQVVKNTLAKRAIEDSRFKDLSQFLVGPTGVVFCQKDVSELAKVVKKFAEEPNSALKIKGGVVEGTAFNADGIKKVSTLPSRQELLAQMVASLESPISGLVGTLQGIVNEFVYTLQAVADKKTSQQA